MKVLNQAEGKNWSLYHGDSTEVLNGIPDNSIHFSITSIPFSSLYTYSATERDLGNCKDYNEFWEHFQFLIKEWVRVIMPGRLISIHCMNLPTSKERDGYIGINDFRGDIIRAMQQAGMIYHSEVCIWKDPVIAMQRTKALGLLHKQIVKDSCMSRQGIPDYLVTFRKKGDNPERVEGLFDHYAGDKEIRKADSEVKDSINIWQQYASPVWFDINPSDTLQHMSAREDKDERHICPLQLQVIERALQLWTNPNDIVIDPFNGIGSSGYRSIQMGRRYIGIELKQSYYEQSVKNLQNAEKLSNQGSLFDLMEG
jgi:DNA modification methylase